MRIVGGKFRGRPLAHPSDMRTRPTSDRVREAIFNILVHGVPDFSLEGAKVLDLFAGTGALGLEALSRGARYCLFVDNDPDTRGLIRRNIEALGLTGVTKVYRRDARELGPAGNQTGFNLVFADPPYQMAMAEPALEAAASGGWLAPGAVVVVEERKGTPLVLPAAFALLDRRSWADTEVTFARLP
jgi:16S rRNA (guanine966-N2)-methyltransferase